MKGWISVALAAAVMVSTIGLVQAQGAEPVLIILPFQNDESGRIETVVLDELLGRNEYMLEYPDVLLDEAESFGQTAEQFLSDPINVRDFCSYVEINGVILGGLDRPRRPRELTLTFYNCATGEAQTSLTVDINRGDPEAESLEWALTDLEDHISAAVAVGTGQTDNTQNDNNNNTNRDSELVSDNTNDNSNNSSDTRDSDANVGLRASATTATLGWFVFEGGFDVMQRNFTLVAENGGVQYESGFYPGVEATFELYPVRAFSPGTLDGLGLSFRAARYFVDTLFGLEDGTDLDIPTRHREVGFAVLYHHLVGPVEISAKVGWQSLAFALGANDVYQSSEYNSFAMGVGAHYAVVANLLRLGLNTEILPSPALGDAELLAFGNGSSFGFAFEGDIEFTFLDSVRAVGFYQYRSFSSEFDGAGESELTGVLDASDTYQQLGLRLSYSY